MKGLLIALGLSIFSFSAMAQSPEYKQMIKLIEQIDATSLGEHEIILINRQFMHNLNISKNKLAYALKEDNKVDVERYTALNKKQAELNQLFQKAVSDNEQTAMKSILKDLLKTIE